MELGEKRGMGGDRERLMYGDGMELPLTGLKGGAGSSEKGLSG